MVINLTPACWLQLVGLDETSLTYRALRLLKMFVYFDSNAPDTEQRANSQIEY
jgi:hypothetical protein